MAGSFLLADIRGSAYGDPSPGIAVQAAFLQNTFEQAALAMAAHLALATLVTGPATFFIPVAVGMFVIERLAFKIGYRKGRQPELLAWPQRPYPPSSPTPGRSSSS